MKTLRWKTWVVLSVGTALSSAPAWTGTEADGREILGRFDEVGAFQDTLSTGMLQPRSCGADPVRMAMSAGVAAVPWFGAIAGPAAGTVAIPVAGEIIIVGAAAAAGAYLYIGKPLADLIAASSAGISVATGSERVARRVVDNLRGARDTRRLTNHFTCSKLRNFLNSLGFSQVNQAGSHGLFGHPTGAIFRLICHNEHDVSPVSIQAIKKLLIEDLEKFFEYLRLNGLS